MTFSFNFFPLFLFLYRSEQKVVGGRDAELWLVISLGRFSWRECTRMGVI